MQITERLPTPLPLLGGDTVQIATQRWALEPWEGEADPPTLELTWARKPRFAVNGSRSCAELAIVRHLHGEGWHGVWVNSYRRELRSEWFPAPAVKTLAETGAPAWAVEVFNRLRAANGGTLGGFFDVFAWREPGQVRFYEAKVGPDTIKPTQLKFVELALRFHPLGHFTIIEVAGPSLRGAPGTRSASARKIAERETRRPLSAVPGSQRQDVLRGAARELLRMLEWVDRPDERETRKALRDVAAAIEVRREDWPPE